MDTWHKNTINIVFYYASVNIVLINVMTTSAHICCCRCGRRQLNNCSSRSVFLGVDSSCSEATINSVTKCTCKYWIELTFIRLDLLKWYVSECLIFSRLFQWCLVCKLSGLHNKYYSWNCDLLCPGKHVRRT